MDWYTLYTPRNTERVRTAIAERVEKLELNEQVGQIEAPYPGYIVLQLAPNEELLKQSVALRESLVLLQNTMRKASVMFLSV